MTIVKTALCVASLLAIAAKGTRLAVTSKPIELKAATTVVTLTPKRNLPVSGRRIFLVVRGLSAQNPPGIVYDIYLGLPRGAKPAANDRRYVGSINFYGVTAVPSSRFLSFDVTAALSAARRNAPVRVTLIASGATDPSSKAAVAQLELVEQ